MSERSVVRSYRQSRLDSAYDAIVIGSGIGGLSAAALLSKYGGRRVLVLERHYVAGGFTHVFQRPGFQWDVGVHYIGRLRSPDSELRRMFDHLTGGSLHWDHLPDVYDRIILNSRTFEFPTGKDRFRDRMKRYFPSESYAIDRYMKAVSDCVRRSSLYFAERALPPLVAAGLGGVLRYPFLRWAGRTTAQVLGALTSNRELIAVLTGQWGNYGLPPGQSSFGIHAIIADHYFEGGSYPAGGAARIAVAIEPLIRESGGEIVVGAEVASILTDSRQQAIGVRMADGREIRSSCVLSDAGAWNTYRRLLPPGLPGVESVLREMERVPSSMAHLCLYVGLKGTSRELQLDAANLWVHASEDHDGNVRRFTAGLAAPFPLLFISSPSAKDSEFERRYPGRSTMEVITLAPYDWFRRWEETRWKKRGQDYEAFKKELSSRMLDHLYEHFPATRGRVVHAELSTPLSTRHFSNHPHGEIYGLAHTPERFRLRRLGPRAPVGRLYLTGQDAAVCGVTGALMGGVLAASAVLGRNLLSALTRSSPPVNTISPSTSAARTPPRPLIHSGA